MRWSRVLLSLLTLLILSSVLALVGVTPLEASARHGYFSFTVHGPPFGLGFGHRYRPYYYRPYVRLGSPYPYYYRPVYARRYPRPTYASYQGYYYGSAAIRTLVKPKRAEVYVDGYYAGIVDDFDGVFQKLYLAPGEHAVELRLEGHRTFRRRILATPSHTQKIRHEMVPLGPAETEPPVESGAAESPEPQDRGARPASPPEPRQPPPPPPSTAPAPPTSSVPRSTSLVRFGVLTLRVQPAEAQVRIDGEVWGHLGGMEELSIHLPAGTHWIELLRDGQPAFSTEVEIQLGQTTPLNIRLAP